MCCCFLYLGPGPSRSSYIAMLECMCCIGTRTLWGDESAGLAAKPTASAARCRGVNLQMQGLLFPLKGDIDTCVDI